jgi:hypothetical protein
VAKAAKMVRGKFTDEKYMGSEPDLRGEPTQVEIVHAYNWYNYFYSSDEAREFAIAYLREIKYDKKVIKNVARSNLPNTVGWNCRILTLGGNLPEDIKERMFKTINAIKAEQETDQTPEKVEAKPVVVDIQKRIADKAGEMIGEIEGEIDTFILEGKNSFDMKSWLMQKEIKGPIAQRIADFYRPLYSELFDAYNNKDEQLKEGYSHFKKPRLKAYMEFVRDIVGACEARQEAVKAIRKPRKKKAKTPQQLVSKLKFKDKDDTYKLTSVKPEGIVASNQLWLFNTKNRNLLVYNAMGPAGLNIKGSSITGYDEKTSIIKTLRKPENHLPNVVDGGKIVLKKVMENIKGKSKPVNGRMNADMIILRIIK